MLGLSWWLLGNYAVDELSQNRTFDEIRPVGGTLRESLNEFERELLLDSTIGAKTFAWIFECNFTVQFIITL
jgi:hypothetical protein